MIYAGSQYLRPPTPADGELTIQEDPGPYGTRVYLLE